jgi:predicted thioredoxin/glutaredoxin
MVAELDALSRTLPLPPVSIVDVDGDPDLVRRYGLNVPVLLLDGTVVCRHRLDKEELRRLLRV